MCVLYICPRHLGNTDTLKAHNASLAGSISCAGQAMNSLHPCSNVGCIDSLQVFSAALPHVSMWEKNSASVLTALGITAISYIRSWFLIWVSLQAVLICYSTQTRTCMCRRHGKTVTSRPSGTRRRLSSGGFPPKSTVSQHRCSTKMQTPKMRPPLKGTP